MTPNPAESARLALFCAEAEAVGPVLMPPTASQEAQGAVIAGGPPLPPWIAKDHALTGWITGSDSYLAGFLNLDPRRVFYGWTMEGEDGVTAVLRGTQSMAEWSIDASFLPMIPHAGEGYVETGFWTLHSTLQSRDLRGTDGPLLKAFSATRTTVTGHSLGATLATFVTLELAEQIGPLARGRFIASPHPGNAVFAAYFAGKVTDYAVYAYARDIVPRVPGGLGYCALPNLITLPANPLVPDTVTSNHHAGNYAFMIDAASIALVGGGYPR